MQCSTLSVPLDWSRPEGTKLRLALIRRPATDRQHRIGSVVFNFGGPGDAGTKTLRDFVSADRVPAGLDKRFDLVSWDPRGTGRSDGVACTPAKEMAAPDPDPTPDTPAELHELEQRTTQDTERCLRVDHAVIPFVGTADTVRDLDAIRAALGDAQLTYVGYSYGTEIGLEYLARSPKQVRAMVLDGVAIPGADPVTAAHTQAASFEADIDAFLDNCRTDPSCAFGGGDPRAALTGLMHQLENGTRLPASYSTADAKGHEHERKGTLGIGELYPALALPLYNRDDWPALAQALAAATDPAHPDGSKLLSFRDLLAGRQPDGSWDHTQDALTAISCADQSQRATSALGEPGRIAAWSKDLPIFGGSFASGLPGCYLWPRARDPLHEPTAQSFSGAPPIVLVNATMDPATPYGDAEAMQRILPAGSVLVTWVSAEHTGFGRGSACLDAPLVAYLETRVLPPSGLRCTP